MFLPELSHPLLLQMTGESVILPASKGFFKLDEGLVGFLKAGFIQFQVLVFSPPLDSFLLHFCVFLFVFVIALVVETLVIFILLLAGFGGVLVDSLALAVVLIFVV